MGAGAYSTVGRMGEWQIRPERDIFQESRGDERIRHEAGVKSGVDERQGARVIAR